VEGLTTLKTKEEAKKMKTSFTFLTPIAAVAVALVTPQAHAGFDLYDWLKQPVITEAEVYPELLEPGQVDLHGNFCWFPKVYQGNDSGYFSELSIESNDGSSIVANLAEAEPGVTYKIGVKCPLYGTWRADSIDVSVPHAQQSWVQLYDRNYTNELTALVNLNLSNAGIDPVYTTGGYALTTTETTNDTLVFPEPGHYLVHVQLTASFLWSITPQTFGNTYQILFDIFDGDQRIANMNFNGMVPNETAQQSDVAEVTLSRSLIVYNPSTAPNLKITLSNFNFDLAFEKELSVFNILIQVQKLEK